MPRIHTKENPEDSLTRKRDPIPLLMVDDDEDEFFLAQDLLADYPDERYHLEWEPGYQKALKLMQRNLHALYLVDYRLGKHNGIDLISEARKAGCHSPIIILTGKGNIETDRQSLRAGASDYLLKDELNADLLERSIRYALERNEIQAAIIEQEEKYRSLFEQSLDAILFANENGFIRNSNSSLLDMLGYSQAELYNIKFSELFAREQDYHEWLAQSQSKGFVRNMEVQCLTKANNIITARLSSSHIAIGHKTGTQAILHDVSMLRKAEEEMRIARQMNITSKMSRIIAHEVRNPLTNINLALEEMNAEFAGDEELEFYSGIINRNANRIEELITRILNSSKINELEIKINDLHEIIRRALLLCGDRVRLKDVDIQTDFDRKDIFLSLDEEKMKMALVNIVVNAVEAVEEEDAPKIILTTRQLSDAVQLDITDNGMGMDARALENMFEPFYSSKNSGMGLGMASTYTILTKHNAQISLDSKVGRGTRFSILFPLNT